MKVKKAAGHVLATLGASATVVLGMASCVPRNGDINRVQPGYVRKAIFQTEDEWYYRRTIVKSETTNRFAIEGMGDWSVERVRFEIQENLLIAYKPYESIPGSTYEDNTFYKGPVIAAWPITSHFDIQRGYDTFSNRSTNVIAENTTDRPWYDRAYMRVDFANNVLESANTIWADRSAIMFPIQQVSTGSYWTNLDTRPTDQFASRFSDDYVEITDQAMLGMDFFACWAFSGQSFTTFASDACGFGEAKVRHSFLRVREESDYQPRYYPDSVIRKNADGTIFDPETGEVVRENIYSRFGIFRIQLPTYDRGYGYTESGRLWRARIYNLWERHTDDNGEEIPFAERTPKPIIWYLNAEYPARWKEAADITGREYNHVFRSMVADMMGRPVDQVPNMFEVRENDCNEVNIIETVLANPGLMSAVQRAVCEPGDACVNTANIGSKIGVGNLKKVCTSLESATTDPNTGRSGFEWQRIGDMRYNLIVFLNNPQLSGWGGLGPSNADARTGEVISGTAYVRGHSYEIGAATVNDYIDFINDEQSVTEIIYGQQIRKHIAATGKRRELELRASGNVDGLADRLDSRIAGYGATPEDRIPEMRNPDELKNRMEMIKGTRLEERLVTQFDLAMAGNGAWQPNMEVTDALWNRAAPWGQASEQNPFGAISDRARRALEDSGLCFLNADFDPHWAGLAYNMQNKSRAERYQEIGTRLLAHVILHEVGHNVGLAHNFEGSYDALNYNGAIQETTSEIGEVIPQRDSRGQLIRDSRFWNNTCVEGVDFDDCSEPAIEAAYKQRQIEVQYDEFRHTTVMEYMSSKGLFADYLGKYDEAAIRFAYAEQVEVFSNPAVVAPGGEDLREWRYLNNYKDIPNHLCGGTCPDTATARAVISDREWVTFDPQNPPANEVPYLFCDNAFNQMTPFCATFDYGSSLTEVFMNYKSMWQDYFFFNNFIRDRLVPLAWSPARATQPVFMVFNFTDIVAQYYYILSANAQSDATDPFNSSYLRNDMASVLGNGLNFATEVMSTPEPERMCIWTAEPAVYLNGAFLNDCDEYAPVNSPYAIAGQAIDVPLGDSRPASLRWTDDYEEFVWAYVGSFFDKANTLVMLGWTRPRLFRFNYDLDQRNRFISNYRLFGPEIRDFYNRIMNFDGNFIRQLTAVELGSYWCRGEDTSLAYTGFFEPRRMIDLETGEAFPGPSEQCQNPAFLYPQILANIPFNAMFISHALFSSDFDAQLDMGKELKIYVRGADDDFEDWQDLPNCLTAEVGTNCFCGMTDSLTGLEYRGLQLASDTQSIACRLIDAAQAAQEDYEESGGDPRLKDFWRGRVERLEFARDLYRLYHNR